MGLNCYAIREPDKQALFFAQRFFFLIFSFNNSFIKTICIMNRIT
jgi:hypothetical protein